MKLEFSDHKNNVLRKERGVCFDDVVEAVLEGRVLRILEHPNKSKYAHQRLLLVWIKNYVYVVPYVEDTEKIFLKTIFPSRQFTKLYTKKGGGND